MLAQYLTRLMSPSLVSDSQEVSSSPSGKVKTSFRQPQLQTVSHGDIVGLRCIFEITVTVHSWSVAGL